VLALVLANAGGIVIRQVLTGRRDTGPAQISAGASLSVREAQDALRPRYANGPISWEEYLHGKVELED
jgi:uncharacterized membrane protein